MLGSGEQIPDLIVPDDRGESVRLRSLLGGPLVLWFYPKDDTSG
jgi:peroxiredoxin Q/BCP